MGRVAPPAREQAFHPQVDEIEYIELARRNARTHRK
jgi:hypothetical protein